MVLTPSNMLSLGTEAPTFSLLDVNTNKIKSLEELCGKRGTVIVFMCNHCPYVQHILEALKRVAEEYIPKGIAFIGINANNASAYPEDSPEKMKALHLPFPYLFDESQAVAKAYNAACTPDVYLFDAERTLVYRGQFDPSRPGNELPSTGESLRLAMNQLLEEKQVTLEQRPSMGCNIKWK